MTYQERAERVAQMIEERLGIRGRDLETKLRRAGRLLPKSIQRDGQLLVSAVKFQGSPKLARFVDDAAVQKAHKAITKHLSELDGWDRRKGTIINLVATNAANFLAIGACLVAVLMWRGFL